VELCAKKDGPAMHVWSAYDTFTVTTPEIWNIFHIYTLSFQPLYLITWKVFTRNKKLLLKICS
jgi:hypothetical protein